MRACSCGWGNAHAFTFDETRFPALEKLCRVKHSAVWFGKPVSEIVETQISISPIQLVVFGGRQMMIMALRLGRPEIDGVEVVLQKP